MLTAALLLCALQSQEPAPLPLESNATTAGPQERQDEAAAPHERRRPARVHTRTPASFSGPAAARAVGVVFAVLAGAGALAGLLAAPLGFLFAAPGFAFWVAPAGAVLWLTGVAATLTAVVLEATRGRWSLLLLARLLLTPLVMGATLALGLLATGAGMAAAYWVTGDAVKKQHSHGARAIVWGGLGSGLIAGLGLVASGLASAGAASLVYGGLALLDAAAP